VDKGLTSEEREAIAGFYDFSKSQRTPMEALAEDFYFTIRGDKASPFWQQWFENSWGGEAKMGGNVVEKIAKLKRTAGVNPLEIVEAVLDAFAEELVYNFGGEEHVWYYGIAKDALKDVQKEDRLSYENRSAPHQYYYTEDLEGATARPRKQPLKVDRPDVTMRGVKPFGLGLV